MPGGRSWQAERPTADRRGWPPPSAVDRQVEGAAHAKVVEGGRAGVEEEEGGGERRLEVHARRVPDAEAVGIDRWDRRPVGVASLHRGGRLPLRGPEPPLDPVGVALGLGRGGPLPERGVPLERKRRPGTYEAKRYGPVAGTGWVPTSALGVVDGTGDAYGKVSWYRKSGSGSRRWKVTVRVASSTMMPSGNWHGRDRPAQAGAPTISWRNEPAPLSFSCRVRSIAYRKSAARTGDPSEYRSPGRRTKV
jgi:hypothetical protein